MKQRKKKQKSQLRNRLEASTKIQINYSRGLNEFRWFLSQLSTNFHEILQALGSSDYKGHTLKMSLKNSVNVI